MARHRAKKTNQLPALLVRLIRAAEANHFDSEHSANPDVLRACGSLALRIIPAHGVFVPGRDEVSLAIERIAADHLAFREARLEYRAALKTVEPFDKRDAIEVAHSGLMSASDDAYFYAGLAFGITLACLSNSTTGGGQ